LREEGISQEALDRVQSPMGVEINAILPEEIAVSVVAQMIQTRRSRPGNR
jgi:xanthine dehydrogenase accessory factor